MNPLETDQPTSTMSFKQAYGLLQRHAETLRSQREPDLDQLLAVVQESVAAYQVCKAKIDAVERALEETLKSAEEQS